MISIRVIVLILSLHFSAGVSRLFGARVGLFFGNFDPVHSAHTQIISGSMKLLSLDRIYVIPYAVSDSEVKLSLQTRCEMLQTSFEPETSKYRVPCDQLSGWNKKVPLPARPATFIKRALKELFYLEGWDNQFFQIMGTDEFHQMAESGGFPKPDQPLSIVVIKRPGYNQTVPRFLIPELGERLFPIDLETPRVSSKEVRDLLKKGIISPHLSEKTANFIKSKALYGYKENTLDKLPAYLQD